MTVQTYEPIREDEGDTHFETPASNQGFPQDMSAQMKNRQPEPPYARTTGSASQTRWEQNTAQPQAACAPAVQQKSHGWIVAIVVVACLCGLGVFGMQSCSKTVEFVAAPSITAPASPSAPSVAVIEIGGTIQYDNTASSPEGLKQLLDQATADDHIKAVVLRVNSGGGVATAGEEMACYVREFKEQSHKPVVVSSASVNASAAYEISSQADYIYVAKSTEIGAIGTAMELHDLSGLLDMLGIDIDVISSSDSKDSSYGYRPLTDEEREYYQHMIDQINEVFIENVAEGRSMSVKKVRKLATGLTFTGMDAVDNHLADDIGTLEDAKNKAANLAGLQDYESYLLVLPNADLLGLKNILGSEEKSFDLNDEPSASQIKE